MDHRQNDLSNGVFGWSGDRPSKLLIVAIMNSPHWHPTNGGSDSRPVIWKLEGNEVLVVTGSVAAAIGLFRYLTGSYQLPVLEGMAIALVIPGLTLFVILKFVSSRPPSFGKDMLAWHALRWRSRVGICPTPLFKAETETEQ